ncbi:MAG: sulfotransferase [Myxococcales bacterium]|nr:sulfotransferase [Myxococcales bacterium]
MVDQVFVVGTGRCGSTLLSSLLRMHPQIASISEFFPFVTDLGTRVAPAFPPGDVTAAQLWDLLATCRPRQTQMLRLDVAMPEVLYPWRSGHHRFDAASGVPPVAQVTLPHLSGDPDGLFDRLRAAVAELSPAPIGVQYRRVFDWFAAQQGARGWAERSGGSLRIAHRLLEHFPAARLVHIVRDGRDTAVSMSEHTGFRMVFTSVQMMETLGVDPFETDARPFEDDLDDDLAALLPERCTREAFLAYATPPPLCGHYWSGEILEGLAAIGHLAEDRLLTLRYEDFLAAPRETVRRLGAFVREGEPDAAWVEAAAASIRPPRSSWRRLAPKLRSQLEHACAPGFQALAEHGIVWSE